MRKSIENSITKLNESINILDSADKLIQKTHYSDLRNDVEKIGSLINEIQRIINNIGRKIY